MEKDFAAAPEQHGELSRPCSGCPRAPCMRRMSQSESMLGQTPGRRTNIGSSVAPCFQA